MTELLSYLTAHPWLVSVLLGVIALVSSKRSQLDSWAEMNPRLAGVMKILRGVSVDPFLLRQGLSLIFLGRLPEPPAAKPTSKLPPLTIITLALACLGLTGCAASKPMPIDPTERAAHIARAVREAVAVKLRVEQTADAALREYCPQLDALLTFLPPEQVTTDILSACRAYVETEPPVPLAIPIPPPAPTPTKPEPDPEAPDAGPLPVPAGQ